MNKLLLLWILVSECIENVRDHNKSMLSFQRRYISAFLKTPERSKAN